MGLFYCHGCDNYHDSRGDAGYNLADGKEYCDETLPEEDNMYPDLAINCLRALHTEYLCNRSNSIDVMYALAMEALSYLDDKKLRSPPTNPATLAEMGVNLGENHD